MQSFNEVVIFPAVLRAARVRRLLEIEYHAIRGNWCGYRVIFEASFLIVPCDTAVRVLVWTAAELVSHLNLMKNYTFMFPFI